MFVKGSTGLHKMFCHQNLAPQKFHMPFIQHTGVTWLITMGGGGIAHFSIEPPVKSTFFIFSVFTPPK
jgi:hypothetical protein